MSPLDLCDDVAGRRSHNGSNIKTGEVARLCTLKVLVGPPPGRMRPESDGGEEESRGEGGAWKWIAADKGKDGPDDEDESEREEPDLAALGSAPSNLRIPLDGLPQTRPTRLHLCPRTLTGLGSTKERKMPTTKRYGKRGA